MIFMTDLDIESDAFLKLLTEAMRAGPGSPEWRQAVETLRGKGASGEEYQLILTAREHLESGKGYRAVRPGPEFTRKVLEGIEKSSDAGNSKGWNTTTIVASIGGLLLIGVVVVLLAMLWKSPTGQSSEDLAGLYFPVTKSLTTFDTFAPDGWRRIGPLPVIVRSGLRAQNADGSAGEVMGGGVVANMPIAANETIAIEVTLDASNVSDDGIAQIFLTDQPEFSADRATTPHELIWLTQGPRVQVILPSGRVESSTQTLPKSASILVRLVLNRDRVLINSDGQALFDGGHLLDPTKPRYLGLRFLSKAGVQVTGPAFLSVRFLVLGEK